LKKNTSFGLHFEWIKYFTTRAVIFQIIMTQSHFRCFSI
jgi:hypothetical protein